jgi:nitric oxide reductase activation protein
LGRKLQLRTESNLIKTIRKRSGKINKRQLHEAAVDCPNLFYKSEIESHNDATIHITVDASSSMTGKKWEKTMTMLVAICKATSMIDNIHVTVSFRTTHQENGHEMPYVIMAYDSKVDKFSKVKHLFPFLSPNGYTPEGLAFEAIMDLFAGMTPDEEDRYFLNLSDGQPYYSCRTLNGNIPFAYHGKLAVDHTRTQVNKIRRRGVNILSYFIEDDDSNLPLQYSLLAKTSTAKRDISLKESFQGMYGKNAEFIDVENLGEIARTINALFLKREK